jgi:glycosyltransferase involved in cell wall biosynthesis
MSHDSLSRFLGGAEQAADALARVMSPWTTGRDHSQAVRAMLVDPSLFTGPYDAALTTGLIAAGVTPTWAVRPTRPGDRPDLEAEHADPFFYQHVDGLKGVPGPLRSFAKGIAHAVGLGRLMGRVTSRRPDVVHFQWTVVPALDALAILLLRRQSAVVLTVHDTTPFNADSGFRLQRIGHRWPMRLADRIIVHTNGARQTLIAQGIPGDAIAVVPHGPLRLRVPPSPTPEGKRDPRYTFVLFGELKPYKGIDVLVEAVALLPAPVLSRMRVLVVGRPQMDIEPLVARIAALGLREVIDLRPRRLSEEEMAELFACADCFVFPYRRVDASGVYFLTRSMGRWVIASRVGVFADHVSDGVDGDLVPPQDASALASSLMRAVNVRATPPEPVPALTEWSAIGIATLAVYRSALQPRACS